MVKPHVSTLTLSFNLTPPSTKPTISLVLTFALFVVVPIHACNGLQLIQRLKKNPPTIPLAFPFMQTNPCHKNKRKRGSSETRTSKSIAHALPIMHIFSWKTTDSKQQTGRAGKVKRVSKSVYQRLCRGTFEFFMRVLISDLDDMYNPSSPPLTQNLFQLTTRGRGERKARKEGRGSQSSES